MTDPVLGYANNNSGGGDNTVPSSSGQTADSKLPASFCLVTLDQIKHETWQYMLDQKINVYAKIQVCPVDGVIAVF